MRNKKIFERALIKYLMQPYNTEFDKGLIRHIYGRNRRQIVLTSNVKTNTNFNTHLGPGAAAPVSESRHLRPMATHGRASIPAIRRGLHSGLPVTDRQY